MSVCWLLIVKHYFCTSHSSNCFFQSLPFISVVVNVVLKLALFYLESFIIVVAHCFNSNNTSVVYSNIYPDKGGS